AAGAEARLPAAEERFEEIAESGAAKIEFGLAPGRARPAPAPWRGGGRGAAPLLPFRPQFVVTAPFFRIAQNFVGFVDLLEFRLSGDLVLCDIGVITARELAEG